MVKDIIVSAMQMLGMDDEADNVTDESGTPSALAEKFIRFYNLVVSEIAEEYRRHDYTSPPVVSSLDEETAKFDGISPRLLAYGVATEYCITEGLDDAVTWDNRYKTALSMVIRPSVALKRRRFY